MSSSRGRRPTTAWRARARRALLLFGGTLLLAALPAATFAAEGAGGPCIRVVRQEAVLEGGGLRVRGNVINACPYVVRNVRVQVETGDKEDQVLGTEEGLVEPSMLGAQEGARFDIPLSVAVRPATVSVRGSWRGPGSY